MSKIIFSTPNTRAKAAGLSFIFVFTAVIFLLPVASHAIGASYFDAEVRQSLQFQARGCQLGGREYATVQLDWQTWVCPSSTVRQLVHKQSNKK